MSKEDNKSILDQLTQKKKHDFKNALLTLEIFSDSLAEGYSFDDQHAEQKRKLIVEAIQTIKAVVADD